MSKPLPVPLTQTQTVVCPSFTITVLANGQFQTQTNIQDKSLILGLLETAKFQVMLAPPDPSAFRHPGDGFAVGLWRKLHG